MKALLISALIAAFPHPAWSLGDAAPAYGAAAGLSPSEFRGLLQRFVDKAYLKAFRHLGDERDFDHGHILFDSQSKRPQAILYHTQEMARRHPPASDFGYIDPHARNWIQWIHEDRIENASRYQRSSFPRSGSWGWFVERRLPILRQYHTIIDRMLDPALVRADTSRSLQWIFTRIDCASMPIPAPEPERAIDILLPTGERVCLALSAA